MPEGVDDAPAAKRARSEHHEVVTAETLAARIRGTAVLAGLPPPEGGGAPPPGLICTHHGTFHADEAMACAMLKCLPTYATTPVLRTRNPAEIEKASIVVDVGGIYDPARNRYDHHQPSFVDTYSEAYPEIKLSSAGLTFKHFGNDIIKALCGPLDDKISAKIVAKTYDSIVRELDAIDNGVEIAEAPRYRFVTNLSSRVGRLNPSWQETTTPDIENAHFKEAMLLAAKEFCDTVRGYCMHWLPANSIVEEALSKRRQVHPSGEIMQLPRFCPWQEHLFDLEGEAEDHRAPLTKYVIFQDSRAGWRVQAVPKVRGSFENRLPLPKPWRGLRDKELSDVAAVPDCVFVHTGGFIGGNASESGALEMAAKALAFQGGAA